MRPWQITTLAKIENLVPAVTAAQREAAEEALQAIALPCFPDPIAVFFRMGDLIVTWNVGPRFLEMGIEVDGQTVGHTRTATAGGGGGTVVGPRIGNLAHWLVTGASAASPGPPTPPPASFTTPFLAPQRIVDWLNHWVTQGAAGEIQQLIEREVRLPAALEERETDQYALLVRGPHAQLGEERSVCLSVLGLLNSLVWPSGCRIVAHYGDARAGERLLRFALATHEEYQAKAGPDTPPTLTPARS